MTKEISLKSKLVSAFATVTLFVILVGSFGYFYIKELSNGIKETTSKYLPSIYHLSGFRGAQYEALLAQSDLLQTTDKLIWSKRTEDLKSHVARAHSEWKNYSNLIASEIEQNLANSAKSVFDKRVEEFNTLVRITEEAARLSPAELDGIAGQQIKSRLLSLSASSQATQKQLITEIGGLITHKKEASIAFANGARDTAERDLSLMLAALFVCSAISLFLGFFLSKRLSAQVRGFSRALEESGKKVQDASSQLNFASQNVSASAVQSAASLEETVSSLEQISSMLTRTADNAKLANDLSRLAKQSASEGSMEVTRLCDSMQEIARDRKRIEDIISVIDSIAFQTNLLALNAAVEAARAGEHGKGFAVVAEAVRNLAQKSSAAAKDIAKLIKDSVEKSEAGLSIAHQSGEALSSIVENVNKVTELISEIASASLEQASGVVQINKAMNELDRVTQSNAASAEECAAASEKLLLQANEIEGVSNRLQVFTEGGNDHKQPQKALAKSPTKSSLTKNNTAMVPLKKANSVSRVQKASALPAPRSSSGVRRSRAEELIPFDSDEDDEHMNVAKIGTTQGF